MTPAAKKGKYDTKFKQQVIQFAERFSNRAAGTKFGLNESTIRGWRKVKKAASTAPATPPPRGHPHAAPLPQHHGWLAQAAPPLTACCAPPAGEPRWHEPARALAAADASLYRKQQCPQQHGPCASEPPSPARGAAAPAFLPPHEYRSQPAASAGARRVLLRGGEYGGGFPEVAVPFTVIAEKALRALCDRRDEATPSGSVTNRELFASFLGLTPNRLVDNVT